MSKYALMLVAAWMLPLAAPVRAQTPVPQTATAASVNEAINHVFGYTAWDDDFFYVAVQVNKPTVTGKNALPFSNPLEDDAIIISIQTDNNHNANSPTAHTVLVVASGAGGAQLYSGTARTPLFNGFADLQAQIEKINMDKNLSAPQQDAARTALFSNVIKFAVVPKGIQRASGSNVPGYTLEVAIPWKDLGGKPAPGQHMGFNVVAQSIIPGSPPLQSLSPQVRTADSLFNPTLWGEVQFSNNATAATAGMLTSPRLYANKPVIDGEIGPTEWNKLSSFSFGVEAGAEATIVSQQRTQEARQRPPFAPQPPRPAVALPTASALHLPATLAAHKAQPLGHLVMARYCYRYQADPRKAAPVAAVTRGNGSSALAHHPLEGVGPWFSYDRMDWHRGQLRELRKAGIEVILPEYRGDARSRQMYADKGLRVLVSALQNLRQNEQDYPLVSLYLDTAALRERFGPEPDLTQPEVQSALYEMVRDFYRTVPAPFRNQVTLTGAQGRPEPGMSGVAYPIFLSSASLFKNFDGAFVSYLRRRFAQEFNGADLLVLGSSDFKPKATLDGYFTETKEKGFHFEAGGWIKTASVGAGYDASYLEYAAGEDSTLAPFLPRRNGDTLRQNWKAALGKNPDWVMLDGWNDYDVAAEIAPTLETGYSAADITREYVRQYLGFTKRNARFLWHDAPAAMQSGRAYSVTVRAENTGIEAWSADNGVGPNAKSVPGFGVPLVLSYRWLRDGAPIQEGTNVGALPGTVLAGQSVNAALNINTAGLAPGAYTLEVRLVEPKGGTDKGGTGKRGGTDKGGTEKGGKDKSGTEKNGTEKASGGTVGEGNPGSTLLIPISVLAEGKGDAASGLPAFAATVLNSDLPQLLETGSVYSASVTLRNDGTQTWRKAQGGRVTLRLFSTRPVSADPKIDSPVAIPDATAELLGDVLPGQTVTVKVSVPTTDPEGKPLPVWKQGDNWSYTARWEVAEGKGDSASSRVEKGVEKAGLAKIEGGLTEAQPIGIVDLDFGARFVSDGTPAVMPVERRLPVRMSVQNTGPQTWKKDQVRIGYHWYYQDGSEFLWEDETTPITQDVAPGQAVTDMLVWVTPPAYDGNYYLVWDVKVGDTWGSTLAASHSGDEIARTVQVSGGRLTFVDLTKLFNLDGIAEEDTPTDGDLDGKGRTLPAALLPPYATGTIVPSGLWQPSERSGPDSARRISFRWGDKDAKSKNFIVCKGQRIDFSKTGIKCGILHILVTSTGPEVQAPLKLIFKEPTSESEDLYTILVSPWNQPPTHGEEIGFLTRRVQGPTGMQNQTGALYHYTLKIKEPRNLIALQLPNTPDIKIAAITLEK